VVILLLLFSHPFPALAVPALVVLWVVVALTVVSGVDYFVRFWRDVLRAGPRPGEYTRPAIAARPGHQP
jgi:phosphatidylglycerophosphate synthase